jgi:serine/threonine protein kinase
MDEPLPRVALKVQRRRYARTAAREVGMHERLRADGPCAEVVRLREAFVDDGHICMAYDLHGRSLESALERGPLPVTRVRRVTRQLLVALERLHRCGLAHTDLKPDNILYDARTGTAQLADLGSARDDFRQGSRPGTREYFSPEILVGAPLSPALDLWSLGCTVFEMLAGRVLFSPRRAAAKKYREFSAKADPATIPVDASVEHDEREETAEQLARGNVVAGKYRVERVLGQGRFATVWAARVLAPTPLARSAEALREFARGVSDPDSEESEQEKSDRAWRRAKGADDLLELALNYEHLLLIATLFGPFPGSWVESGRFRQAYFESDGELRFRPEIRSRSFRDHLRRQTVLRGRDLDLATDFLIQLLQIESERRIPAGDLLRHPWLG